MYMCMYDIRAKSELAERARTEADLRAKADVQVLYM